MTETHDKRTRGFYPAALEGLFPTVEAALGAAQFSAEQIQHFIKRAAAGGADIVTAMHEGTPFIAVVRPSAEGGFELWRGLLAECRDTMEEVEAIVKELIAEGEPFSGRTWAIFEYTPPAGGLSLQ